MTHLGDALHAYLDGELEPAARAAADAHLRECPQCRARLEELREIDAALSSEQVPDPGAAYWESFASRVERRLPAPAIGRTTGFFQWLTGWLLAGERVAWNRALVAVAVCTLVVYVGMRGFRTSPARLEMESPAPQATTPPPPGARKAVRVPEVTPTPSPQEEAPGRASGTQDAPRSQSAALEGEESAGSRSVGDRSTGPVANEGVDGGSPMPARAPLEPAPSASSTEKRDPRREAPSFAVPPPASVSPPGEGPREKQLVAALRGRPEAKAGAPLPGILEAEDGRFVPPDSAAGADAYLAADEWFWPRREAPELRPAGLQIAAGLARHTDDPRALLRARAYAAWLASTSPSDSERTHWEDVLRRFPPR